MNKIIYFLIVFCFSFLSHPVQANYLASPDSFRFEGTLKCGESAISGMVMNVFLDGKKIHSKTSNRQGNFFFYFLHNKNYTIELIKSNFILQKIIIDTKVSDILLKNKGIEMAIDNEIPVFEYYDGLKTEIFDNAVLCYVYNENNSFFEQDRKRSKSSQLTSITSKVNSIRTKLATEANKQANDKLKKKQYEEALILFNRVAELTPSNQLAQDKIKEIGKLIKNDQEQVNKSYNQYISSADEMFKLKKYKDASENYRKASILKPEIAYPSNQVFFIDSLLSHLYSINKNEYDKYRKLGDDNLKNKIYDQALTNFEAALTLLPEEPIVAKLIKNTKAIIDAEKKKKESERIALDDKTNVFIKKASDYSAKKDYANAIAMYNQALQLKPENVDILNLKNKAGKLLAEMAAIRLTQKTEKNYKDTIAMADSCFKKNDLQSALLFFKAAQQIFPQEKYPLKKIKDIEHELKNQLSSNSKQSIKPTQNSTINIPGKETKHSELFDLKSKANALQEQDKLNEAIENLQQALKISKKNNDKPAQVELLTQIASVYYDSGLYKMTVKSFEQAISIKKELKDSPGTANLYFKLGNVYSYIYQYDNAIDALLNAVSIYKKSGNALAKAETYSKLADIYFHQNIFKKSLEYNMLAIQDAKVAGKTALVSNLTNNLGVLYYKMGNFDQALACYNKVVDSENLVGNERNLSLAFNNIGNVNYDWNKYEVAISFYEKSLNLKRKLNFEEGIAVSYLNIGNAYLELKNAGKASEFLNSGLKLSIKLKFQDLEKQYYQSLAKLFDIQNDTINALAAYKELALKGTAGSVGQINETENMYTNESKTIRKLKKELINQKILTENEALLNKQKEQQLAIKEMQLSQQKTKNTRNKIYIVFSLFLAISAGYIAHQFFKRYKQKKKYSEIIEFQNRQITDSIEYAGRIQKAVFPPLEFVKSIFPQSFLLNKPKDIISGDFYFISVLSDKILVAVADCTGHGVPGAFMSMLGYALSKEMIQNKDLGTSKMLDLLRESIMKSLHQTGKDDEAKDGMDIALCIIDQKNMQMEFSGANNPCFIVRDMEFIELKPDRMPIGIHPFIHPFSSQTLELRKDDTIYLFSDGFSDQIGGTSLKKFKKEQFVKLLIEINSFEMEKQKLALDQCHIDWKGNMEQTDDILVLGFKV